MSIDATSVRIYPIESGNERLLAFASVVLNQEFVVHNVRLVRADSGVIVAMPNEEHRGSFRDIAHPISDNCRRRIRRAVIEAYNEEVASPQEIPVQENGS